MAGKPMKFASKRLAFALDQLSKNALADIVVHLSRDCVVVSESQIIAKLQPSIDAVLRARGDKPVSLESAMKRLDDYSQKYRNQQFSDILAEARQYDFDYAFREDQREPFVVIDKRTGREWTCDTPGGCRRLLKTLKTGREKQA